MSSAVSGLGNNLASMMYGMQSRGSVGAPPDPAALASNLLSNLDGDGNGSLSQSELQSAIDGMSSSDSGTRTSADGLFSAMDSDGDGSVTETEIQTTLQTLAESQNFAQGMGGPGGPGGPGAMGGMPPPPPPSSSDSDSDTSSSAISAADTNGDGTVSVDELVAYYQSQSASDSGDESASTSTDTTSSTTSTTGSDPTLTTEVRQMMMQLARTYGDPAQTDQGSTSTLSLSV